MNADQRNKTKQFIEDWKTRGDEKSDTQLFWVSLLRDVLGIERPESFIQFEKRVKLDNMSFIDGFIPSTHVLIEQKSATVDLSKPIRQSDGRELTPYQQALRYDESLPFSQRNKWIIVCNFRQFHIYNRETPNEPPIIVNLEELESNVQTLYCIVDQTQTEIFKETQLSIQAGELVGRLYDALLDQYDNPNDVQVLKSLNKLCVRLVFCLYAEDSDLFGKSQFYHFLQNIEPEDIGEELMHLFDVLNTPVALRNKNLKPKLKAFPYVNGGLFKEEDIEIPLFTEELKRILLHDCSLGFNWSGISPTIFGAVFESTLNPETRRSNGMHYTSIENIHKVIDPLFLTELKEELADIFAERVKRTRHSKLRVFHNKLAELTFFDPACGSGNFLTETYICLRELENDIIKELYGTDYLSLSTDVSPVQVSIGNFYGIEINDFAVSVAMTALWIAECQTIRKTENIIHADIKFLPLLSSAHIAEGNALSLDWENVVPKDKLSYIMGNPPFVGGRLMSREQKHDLVNVFGSSWKNVGNLDYVCAWYKKAVELIRSTPIHAAFVSTNSICQGEQVPNLWKPLFEQGIQINFAWRTFRWDSESQSKAHVHCIIVGFSLKSSHSPDEQFTIYLNDDKKISARQINPYLIDGPITFIESRSTPICDVPEIGIGNKPIDGGNYLFTNKQKNTFVILEPKSEKYFRRWYGSEEFINNRPRWCLWLGDCSPNELRKMKHCLERLEKVREYRLASKSEGTRILAQKPARFHVENMPKTNYIVIPETSSEKRLYIPIGFMTPDVLCSNAVRLIPNATLHHFGILTSSVHMAWMRAVCGRLEMRYRYSKDIVYNNFPWPEVTDEQKETIAQTGQGILDARAQFPDCSLADLYDELTMPPALRKAHQLNDQAVLKAYKFPKNISESDIVARLMKMYQKLTVGK